MSEQQSGDVQDPAQPYSDDQSVQTADQPTSQDEVTTGGELNHAEEPAPVNPDGSSSGSEDDSSEDGDSSDEEPAPPTSVEVSPEDPLVAQSKADVKTDNVHGKDYEVTPEAGYRRV